MECPFSFSFFFFFLSSLLLSSSTRRRFYPQRSSGQAVVTGVVPSPPRYVPSIFFAHRNAWLCKIQAGRSYTQEENGCKQVAAAQLDACAMTTAEKSKVECVACSWLPMVDSFPRPPSPVGGVCHAVLGGGPAR